MGGRSYPRERQCEGCGRTFRGTTRRCLPCRVTERECAICGRTFRGTARRCGSCLATERECVICGRSFRGTERRCVACRATERECVTCGRTFRGRPRRCPTCRATERECVTCGRTFRGNSGDLRCHTCRATERECPGCGRTFRSESRLCPTCRATERECPGCGRTFRALGRYCDPCQRAAADPALTRGRDRRRKGARRARRVAAEVTGPLPASTYARVLASGPCVYCGAPADTVDHVRPLARGGDEVESNLAPACGSCNYSKGSRLLTEWDPERAAAGVAASAAVAAEWARLTLAGAARPLIGGDDQ